MDRRWLKSGIIPFTLALVLARSAAQEAVTTPEEQVIQYHSNEGLRDPVTQLQQRLASGKSRLRFETVRGYLPDLLKELKIPISSQSLVFSKTSPQKDHINPKNPRAVFFSDGACVAWVPGGDFIEVAGIDPSRGPIFFRLDQKQDRPPRFERAEDCMSCHWGHQTQFVPGLILRSVYTAVDGTALAQVPGFVNGHISPLEERWGGWYVTGTHAGSQHLGNIFVSNLEQRDKLDLSQGANVTSLKDRFDTSRYVSPDSDIVALLVLEHEVRMHNLLTRANYETRLALDERPEAEGGHGLQGVSPEWPKQRIELAGELLLSYMLFRDEALLKGLVKGTSGFAEQFQKQGPRASGGRSLRQLDLKSRLLRYPCSFLIYSDSFNALPAEMKTYLWRRLEQILTGKDQSPGYSTLTASDRKNVLEILRETKPEFAEWLKRGPKELQPHGDIHQGQ
jgi:hypothetical protein